MARTERLTVMVDPGMSEELKEMAGKIGMPMSTFLYTLLSIAMNASGNTLAAFGNTLEGLKGADVEHDATE